MTTNDVIIKVSNDWSMTFFLVGYGWAAAWAFVNYWRSITK